jgi:hypothetical protein
LQAEAIVGETAASAAAIKNIGLMVQFSFSLSGADDLVREHLTVDADAAYDCPTM